MWTGSWSKIALIGLCLVLGHPGPVSSERSMVDSDFAKTANYIMKTAMKLPPHILPTLDELDSNAARQNLGQQIGVYMPDRRNPLGVYIPRPSQTPSILNKRDKKRLQPKNLPGINRFDKDLPTFTLQSPIGKLLGKQQRMRQKPRQLQNLQTSASEKHLGRVPYRGSVAPTPMISKATMQGKYQDPYKFEPTDFDFPADFEGVTKTVQAEQLQKTVSLKPKIGHQTSGFQRQDVGKTRPRVKDNNVEKFVPFFVKEVLAKSFLNEPERYLAEYKARERILKRSRDKILANRSEAAAATQPLPTQSASTTPRSSADFPWNPNEYDNQGRKFKGGYIYNKDELSYDLDHKNQYNYLLGETFDVDGDADANQRSETDVQNSEVQVDHPPIEDNPATRTICICCNDQKETQELPREGRIIEIQNPKQSMRVFKHQEFLKKSISCVDQEPIEVVLVFNQQKSSRRNDVDKAVMEISERNWGAHKAQRRMKNPAFRDGSAKRHTQPHSKTLSLINESEPNGQQILEDVENEEVEDLQQEYYDPAKLTYIFSTPTPLLKKSSQTFEESGDFPTHKSDQESPQESLEKPQDELMEQDTDSLRDEDYAEQMSTEFERISTRQKPLKEVNLTPDTRENYEDKEKVVQVSNKNQGRRKVVKKPRKDVIKVRQRQPIEETSTPPTTTINPDSNETEEKEDKFEDSIEKAIHMERRYDVGSAGMPKVTSLIDSLDDLSQESNYFGDMSDSERSSGMHHAINNEEGLENTEPRTTDNEKSDFDPNTLPDMTSGYLFWRMLTG